MVLHIALFNRNSLRKCLTIGKGPDEFRLLTWPIQLPLGSVSWGHNSFKGQVPLGVELPHPDFISKIENRGVAVLPQGGLAHQK